MDRIDIRALAGRRLPHEQVRVLRTGPPRLSTATGGNSDPGQRQFFGLPDAPPQPPPRIRDFSRRKVHVLTCTRCTSPPPIGRCGAQAPLPEFAISKCTFLRIPARPGNDVRCPIDLPSEPSRRAKN